MALDIYVVGPGYGEMIILRWTEGKHTRSALIDCYAMHNGKTLISWLKRLKVDSLAFAVATHPHLDHIKNFHFVLNEFQGRVERFWWWGGIEQEAYIEYFDRLAVNAPPGGELYQRADAVRSLLCERRKQFILHGRPEISAVRGVMPIYPVGAQIDSHLSVQSFSPWGDEILKFVSAISMGISGASVVRDTHSECNCVSIGLLIKYGAAQIVLGGDVEVRNWKTLSASKDCPEFVPCVVKVSHHGSMTGRIDEMWTSTGFFGGSAAAKLAVITPWNRRLPNDGTIDEIRQAGFTVLLTGQEWDRDRFGVAQSLDSYVQIRVRKNGKAQVIRTGRGVKVFQPMPQQIRE